MIYAVDVNITHQISRKIQTQTLQITSCKILQYAFLWFSGIVHNIFKLL